MTQRARRDLLNDFIAGCRNVGASGLVRCSSGNVSLRLDDGTMFITANRTWKGLLDASGVVLCRIADGSRIEGGTPSVEAGFHAGVMRIRPDVNVVIHFQTPCATALACRPPRRPIDYDVIPEIPYYIGPVAEVPYLAPGSTRLARAVADAMAGHNMVMMRNHGQVTVGRSFDEAIQRAAFFELACEIILRLGWRASTIPEAGVRQLRRRSAGQAKGGA